MTQRPNPLERHALTVLVVLVAGVATLATLAGAARPLGSSVKNPHGSFREPCEQCHTADGWRPARVSAKFDHAKFGFPLAGAHAAAGCLGCHGSLEFAKAERLCASCHEDPHRGELGMECARCHGARSFLDRAPMVRGHQLTSFPLNGSHAGLDCESCHRSSAQGHLQFVGTRSECQACHLADYRATTNPDHEAGNFPQDCRACHSTIGWNRANFDHGNSGFPLTGRHAATPCASCHAGGYAGTPTACVSCHQAEYDATTGPNHVAAGFPTQCQSCHDTNGWGGAGFDHATTRFALTGAHTTTPCASCHASGYAGTPTACVSCHQADYNRTNDPNHVTAGFSTACETCHNTTGWSGANFNHGATRFALTGAHTTTPCASCHASGYAGTPTACLACHQADWNATTDPSHAAAHFTTTCETCHNTTTFAGARFNHDADNFPVYSGAHAGKWSACSTCHTDPNNYAVFTCLSCHPHSDKAKTDGAHRGRSGYSYNSNSCYGCHPRGRA